MIIMTTQNTTKNPIYCENQPLRWLFVVSQVVYKVVDTISIESQLRMDKAFDILFAEVLKVQKVDN